VSPPLTHTRRPEEIAQPGEPHHSYGRDDVDDPEWYARRRCADALAALQAVRSLLDAGQAPLRAGQVDPALRLMAAIEAVEVAERAAQELRAQLTDLALDQGVSATALGCDPDE
jgi:hypothetical protein